MRSAMLLLVLRVGAALALAAVASAAAAEHCGYEACDTGRPGFVNVHLVPHTHDDVGWLKTVDQYFYGARNDIQSAGVQYILDSLVDALAQNPERKFTYVEMAFFYRWWREQPDAIRALVKQFVSEGRLQFTVGGWCMADEASTHYSSLIDAHTLGLRLLQAEFGDCGRPRAAWQVDPFGHSRELANLHSQLGYDSLYLGRIDYQDKSSRLERRDLEMLWNVSNNGHTIFTGVNFNTYQPPAGFDWEIGHDDPPIMDDARLDGYNVDERVNLFIERALDQAKYYVSSHIMMTMGTDFNYEYAGSWFINMDRLIKHVNARIANGSNVYVFYSTPACYGYAINKEHPVGWEVKHDDFMPYADGANQFWTGYFTSRAALKGYERVADDFLQVSSQLNAMAETGLDKLGDKNLFLFRDAMGILQHHDAVSGTEKQHVAYDYARKVSRGVHRAQEAVNQAYQKLMVDGDAAAVPTQHFCWLLNESICDFTTNPANADQFVVTVYSPVSRKRSHWLRVPVLYDSYSVVDALGNKVQTQVIPINPITRNLWTANNYNATLTSAKFEVIFLPANTPPLGWNTYFFKRVQKHNDLKFTPKKVYPEEIKLGSEGDFVIQNEELSLQFDTKTGQLSAVTQRSLGVTLPFNQTLAYYISYAGDGQKSGAYIFRPASNIPVVLPVLKFAYSTGPLVSEVYQLFGNWAAQVIRLYAGDEHFEVEWTVGPVDVSDDKGREVISFYQAALDNEQGFWTDSNGRQMMERRLNYRPTWKFENTEPVAGNYYPVNSRIFIRDVKKGLQLTVLTDRSQGGSSLDEGAFELMVHRRTTRDDSRGVGEPLSEPGISGKGLIVRGTHYVLFHSIQHSTATHRDMGNKLFFRTIPTFATPTASKDSAFLNSALALRDYWKSLNLKLSWSGLVNDLPANVQILTLQEWEPGTVLLRLEHLFQPFEDAILSNNISINLVNIFKTLRVVSYEELTLGANMLRTFWLQNRLQWSASKADGTNRAEAPETINQQNDGASHVRAGDLPIVLQPAQIRTFKLHLAPTNE